MSLGHFINLYVVAERSIFDSDYEWLDALATLAGLDSPGLAIQVRTKSEAQESAIRLGTAARQVTLGSKAPVFLNGSSELARNLGYKGVHWPEAMIPEAAHDSESLLTAASVHGVSALRRAENAGVNLVVAGAVFDAGSKLAAGRGLQAFTHVARSARVPVLAIGGVTMDRVASCIGAGASGVATVTGVLKSGDIAAAVEGYREALYEAQRQVAN